MDLTNAPHLYRSFITIHPLLGFLFRISPSFLYAYSFLSSIIYQSISCYRVYAALKSFVYRVNLRLCSRCLDQVMHCNNAWSQNSYLLAFFRCSLYELSLGSIVFSVTFKIQMQSHYQTSPKQITAKIKKTSALIFSMLTILAM